MLWGRRGSYLGTDGYLSERGRALIRVWMGTYPSVDGYLSGHGWVLIRVWRRTYPSMEGYLSDYGGGVMPEGRGG